MQQQQQQQQYMRFWSVLLIVVASLVCIFSYIIPFLASVGSGEDPGYSAEQKEAYLLAQSVQAYRKTHPSPGNYAQVAIRQTYDDGTFSKWDTSYVYEGFDDADGENSTHSEHYAHQWVLSTIAVYKGRASWMHVDSLTIVFLLAGAGL